MHRPLVLAAVLASAPVPAQGDTLYAISAGNTLIRIDTASLIATSIGAIGWNSVGGLALGLDGTLYGISTAAPATLIRIDRNSGAGTAIGPVGAGMTFSTGLGSDPTTDDLYGIATGGLGASSRLVRYSKTTGAATVIGESGSNSGTAIVGLEADVGGQLWGIDGGSGHEELLRIDKTTGAATIVAPQGLASFPNIGGFAIGTSGAFWAVNSGTPYTLVRVLPNGTPLAVGALTGATLTGAITGLASPQCAPVVAVQAPRLGTPANPNVFLPGAQLPVLGASWNPSIDHTTFFPGSVRDFMLLTAGATNAATPFGTLLCDLSAVVVLSKLPAANFAVPVPLDCRLAGGRVYTQGVAVTATQLGLTNALDLRIGTP